MLDDKDRMLGEILDCVGSSLDIPPSKYKQAVERYEAVGRHLEGGDYSHSTETPLIYPQGSFRLGTVTRPYRDGRDADYDIDLVCDVRSPKGVVTPDQLKREVGDRLKSHGTYKRLLDDEGRRCWTLNYAEEDGIGFHLDVLPAIPEELHQRLLIERGGVESELTQHSIAITDRQENGVYAWDTSNPFGYGIWFDRKNKFAFDRIAAEQKQMIVEATAVYNSVDQVPDQLVRTPLQRLIQLLKRHRDVRFDGKENAKAKPISIIITTLAAKCYNNVSDPWLALEEFINAVESYRFTNAIRNDDGEWYIPNPTNFGENFADRWNRDGGERAAAFFEWIELLKTDLLSLRTTSSLPSLEERLSPLFGEAQVKSGFVRLGDSLRNATAAGALAVTSSVGLLGTGPGIKVKKHNFYAD